MAQRPQVVTRDHPEASRRVVEIMTEAFHDDPVWGWAFADEGSRRAHQRWFWNLIVEGALRFPYVFLGAGSAAAAVWLPPGASELTQEQEATVEPELRARLGPAAERVLATFACFEAAHPGDEPHFYLSLLGTSPDQRGHGYGLGLLGDSLAVVDAAGMPAYLEASNVGNVPLYARYGFEVRGEFQLPDGGPAVTTMWRPARAPG
jgi:GNAT superfamily N-acetyltransferase